MSARKKPTVTRAMLAANRRNAQLSTGPITPEGKFQAALNACKFWMKVRDHERLVQAFGFDVRLFRRHTVEVWRSFAPDNYAMEVFVGDLAREWWDKFTYLNAGRPDVFDDAVARCDRSIERTLRQYSMWLRFNDPRRWRQWVAETAGRGKQSARAIREAVESRLTLLKGFVRPLPTDILVTVQAENTDAQGRESSPAA